MYLVVFEITQNLDLKKHADGLKTMSLEHTSSETV